jgi:hypothetical protein
VNLASCYIRNRDRRALDAAFSRRKAAILLTIKFDAGEMVPASETYSQKASFYEKMADEECASLEQRKLFARKANSMRILARLDGNRAEAVLRAVKQNSVAESMRPPHKQSLWSRIPELSWPCGLQKARRSVLT